MFKSIPFLYLLVSLMSCGGSQGFEGPSAKVTLSRLLPESDSTYEITSDHLGTAEFKAMKSGAIQVIVRLEGLLRSGDHAVHIHMAGTCVQPNAQWNQGGTQNFCNQEVLGVIWARPKAGDIGNISVDASGTGQLELSSDLWELGTGSNRDITGLELAVHALGEDFAQECFVPHTHAHFNPKIACGTIELVIND